MHRLDCPAALGILEAVAAGRMLAGVEATETGAWVDWDLLVESWLSSTERAAVVIAAGVAAAERHGGLPPRLADAVARAAEVLGRGARVVPILRSGR